MFSLSEVVATGNTTTESAAPAPEVTDTPAQEPASVDKFASKFSALSRKERALQEREKTFAERAARIEKFDGGLGKFKESKDPTDFISFMEEASGVDFSDLIDSFVGKNMSKEPVSELDALKAEIAAMKEGLTSKEAAEKQALEDSRKVEENKVYSSAKSAITEHITSNTESLEILHSLGQTDMVFDTIKANYEETGEMLDIPTACQWVESYLENQFSGLAKLSKFRKSGDETTEEPQKQVGQFSREPKTISNGSMGAHSRPAPTTQVADSFDRHDRIAALLARNQG